MLRINPSGYYLHKDALVPAVWKKIHARARVYAAVDDNNPLVRRMKSGGRKVMGNSFVVTMTDGDFTWIPRTWFEDMPELIRFRDAIDAHRNDQLAQTQFTSPVERTYTMKPQQLEVLNEVFSYPGVTSGCLALHTGFGKTVVALELIARFGVRTLWLSHTNQLLKQLRERAQAFLGAHVGDLTDESLGGDAPIVTCTIQSLLRRDIPESVLRTFGLLIVDEVHHMSAPSFSQAFHKIGGIPRTIGLSATLERKDGLECVFQWAIGRVLSVRTLEIKIVPYVKVLSGCWTVDIVMNKAGDPLVAQAVTDMLRLDTYNHAILAALADIFTAEPERRVLVLTDRKEHIALLDTMLRAHESLCSLRVGAIHGNVKEGEMDAILHAETPMQILLATYGIAGEGFDCPGLNCVMLASPRRDVRQAVGRILGERVTSLRPLIVDIRNTMGLFYNQGRERIRWYHESGFEVESGKKRSAEDMEFLSSVGGAGAGVNAGVGVDADGWVS